MTVWWDKQIQRADELAAKADGSKELLTFYCHLLRAQKDIYEFLRGRDFWLPSGELQSDLPVLRDTLPGFLKVVQSQGPAPLADEARELLAADTGVFAERLMSYWRDASDLQFFEKALLQPYLRWVVDSGARPVRREVQTGERHCPF